MGEGRKGNESKGKREERGDEVEGGIWPNHKFWRGAHYPRPIAGFKGTLRGGEGRRTERQKRGRREKREVGTGPPIG